jgi:hypothetical protein
MPEPKKPSGKPMANTSQAALFLPETRGKHLTG